MVGYILSQEEDDGKHYPNHFGSIGLSDVESCYSQVQLELYRLFRALQAVRIFIFGVNNFTVEMDAKYVQGMINNPDLQPNTTINQWITGIYCSVFASFTFLLPIILEQMDYHIVRHRLRILLWRMTAKTGWIILIHS